MEPRLFLNECLYEGYDYKWLKNQIDEHYFFHANYYGTEIRFNNPALATIFISAKVEAKDGDTGQIQDIDLPVYQKAYVEGYQSGLRYFDEEYHLPPNLLYGPGGPSFMENLYQLCFVKPANYSHFSKGWANSSLNQPLMISLNVMKEHGKYAALMWRVEELMGKHPDLFKTWEQRGKTLGGIPHNKTKEATLRKARKAVSLFEGQIEGIVKKENGKRTPLDEESVIHEALMKYIELAPQLELGSTNKAIDRYLKHIGKEKTAKEYARQLVRQLRNGN